MTFTTFGIGLGLIIAAFCTGFLIGYQRGWNDVEAVLDYHNNRKDYEADGHDPVVE